MKINFEKKTIEMTKAEAKEASVYGSKEYKEMLKIRAELPEFTFTVITPVRRKANHSVDHLKGLDFDFMRTYIKTYGSEEQLAKLDSFRAHKKDGLKVKAEGYGKVKKWFLNQFPEIEEYRSQIAANIAETRPLENVA